jgi:hypothetical protein
MNDQKRPNRSEMNGDNPTPWRKAGEVPRREPEIKAKFNGRGGGGDSGGGAYPNPHSGRESDEKDRFMGHGGQSGIGYHGHGQLGDQDVEGRNANAPAGGHENQKKE